MASVTLPLLVTAALWWSTTGLILYLNRRPSRSFPLSFAAATVLLVAALVTLRLTAPVLTIGATYAAFIATLTVWGWLEMGFLMGFVTGPRRHACPTGCTGLPHLGHAIQAILYHEVAILGCGALIYLLTRDASNGVGLATFLVLWGMRQSAKLNLFLGVPNLGEVYLPGHMRYLASLFRRRPMNLLFPVSVTLGTLVCAYFVRAATTAGTAAGFTADTMLATLTGLGVLEHWFLVLPLPTEQLWSWSLRRELPGVGIRPCASPREWGRQAWDDTT